MKIKGPKNISKIFSVFHDGELLFSASSAEIMDEAGKSYSLVELVKLFNDYWSSKIV